MHVGGRNRLEGGPKRLGFELEGPGATGWTAGAARTVAFGRMGPSGSGGEVAFWHCEKFGEVSVARSSEVW